MTLEEYQAEREAVIAQMSLGWKIRVKNDDHNFLIAEYVGVLLNEIERLRNQ